MNLEKNKYQNLQIIDWEQGNSEYTESFVDMVHQFLTKTLMPKFTAATDGVEQNIWGPFLFAIHTVKGSIGYIHARRMEKITEDFQEYLLQYFEKNIHNEYEPTNEFDEKKKLFSLDSFLYVLEESNTLFNEYLDKTKQEKDTLNCDMLGRKIYGNWLAKRIRKLVDEQYTKQSQKQFSLKQQTPKQESLKYQTNKQPSLTEQPQSQVNLGSGKQILVPKDEQSQKHISINEDPEKPEAPVQQSGCCSTCLLI